MPDFDYSLLKKLDSRELQRFIVDIYITGQSNPETPFSQAINLYKFLSEAALFYGRD